MCHHPHRGGHEPPLHGHHHDCREGGGRGWRRFKSKGEKKAQLEYYKKELESELEAVNELLNEL